LTSQLLGQSPQFRTDALRHGLLPNLLDYFHRPIPDSPIPPIDDPALLLLLGLIAGVGNTVVEFFKGEHARAAAAAVTPIRWAKWATGGFALLREAAAQAQSRMRASVLNARVMESARLPPLFGMIHVVGALMPQDSAREVFTSAVVASISSDVKELLEMPVAADNSQVVGREIPMLNQLGVLVQTEGWSQVESKELVKAGSLDVLFAILERQAGPLRARGLAAGASEALRVLTMILDVPLVVSEVEGRHFHFDAKFAEGLRDVGPRLLKWASDNYEKLGQKDRQYVMQGVFSAFQTVPGRKYELRYALLDLAIRTLAGDELPGSLITEMAWVGLASLSNFLPQFTPALVTKISFFDSLSDAQRVDSERVERLAVAMIGEIDSGAATWPASARAEKVAHLALKVLSFAGRVSYPDESLRCATQVLRTLSAEPSVVTAQIVPKICAVLSNLSKAYAVFSSVFRGEEMTIQGIPKDRSKPIQEISIDELDIALMISDEEMQK
jgi:hypothetical protein